MVQNALYLGLRGLPGGSSLPRLLEYERGVQRLRRRQRRVGRRARSDCGATADACRDVEHSQIVERRAPAFCVFEMTIGRGFAPNVRAANEWMGRQ